MLTSLNNVIILSVTCLFIFILLIHMRKSKNKSDIQKCFSYLCVLMIIWLLGLILQATLSTKLNISAIYFDYIVYIGICLMPVAFYDFSKTFSNTKYKLNKKLLIIPIISLLVLWTNDFHHLFYQKYSTNIDKAIYGWYFYIYSSYTYILLIVSFINLVRYSIKNAGLFSNQAMLFLLGSLIPLVANVLAFSNVISASIYLTPICFAFTILFYALAIFKFSFLKVAPIALQRIVDRISDSYVVLNENYEITDFNKTFINTFKIKDKSEMRGKNFEKLVNENELNIDSKKIYESIKKIGNTDKLEGFEIYISKIEKYFNIEITSIIANNQFLGTLILFKDITQHVKDVKIIEENQNMLIEKERLASLGQMIGGIAHNLKTPIMSVAGATEGVSDLIKEIDLSVGNPSVTEEDYHEITKEMNSWIEKIRTHLSYMSDVITSVKGQAVSFAEEQIGSFETTEFLKRVSILMKHELDNSLITLNIKDNTSGKVSITGNINSLVQVINNMISNSIQAYDGKEHGIIDLTVSEDNGQIIISVKDYACGISDEVKSKLFTQMITTKGKNGTGLGLFMSYSNIKAHFNGDITVESELNKGTEFKIILPVQ